jgi:hAT family C-terminal dimerisation region
MTPLAYWELNSSNYPVLAILARRYLAILTTSASSERYFSAGALTITKLRNRLNKDTFNKLMCLKSWGIIIEDKEDIETLSQEANTTSYIEEASFVY